MPEKVLSIFVDESGDFGPYDFRAPFYCVALVLHDQSVDISNEIRVLDGKLAQARYEKHAIHTGPLIRRESIYSNDYIDSRKSLFNALFFFSRKLKIHYLIEKVRKRECSDEIALTAKLSKTLSDDLRRNDNYIREFDRVIVYYDNGQAALTKVLTSVFSTLYSNVEFRRVQPADYKLFQVADLVCTVELLAEKAENNAFTKSETEFFYSNRNFKKQYLRRLREKKL